MNKVLFRSLILLWTIFFVSGNVNQAQAISVEDSYSKARKAYFDLLDSPRKQKYRDQWLKVRDLFVKVRSIDPQHQRSADALYMAGKVSQGLYDISFVKGDLVAAIDYFDQLALEHPGSSLADDGLLIAAEIFEDNLKDRQGAIDHYRRIVSIYHDGDMYATAKDRLKQLAPQVVTEPPPEPVTQKTVEGTLTGIRYHSYPDFTRVVLDFEGKVDPKPGFVKGEDPRIFIDLSPGFVGDASPVTLGDGRIKQVRLGQYREDVARVVLDLDAAYPYQVFTLSDPFRVIVDVTGVVIAKNDPMPEPDVEEPPVVKPSPPEPEVVQERPAEPVVEEKPVSKPAPPAVAVKPPVQPLDEAQLSKVLDTKPKEEKSEVQVPKSTKGKRFRIVVDPGHGGKDPGAIGPRGVMEKDVTLALAKEVAAQLKSKFKCEVILTRDRDVFIPLDERTMIANRLDADLFISLHANANRSRKPYGVETYYLNFSKNDDVIEVVARENGTSLEKVGDLDMILLDLLANSKINESSRLAAEIQDELVDGLSRKYSDIKDLGVRQGPFHVLWNATMPSVLVEVAFISNKREEKRLADKNFQKHSASSIAAGVGNYLEAYNLAAN